MAATIDKTAYEHVERLLDKEAWRFLRIHGGEWDDVRSEAAVAWCLARRSYDPERGQFTTWLVHCVRCRLLNEFVNTRWAQRHRDVGDFDEIDIADRHHFELNWLLNDMSPDAKRAVKLAMIAPGGGKTRRRVVVDYLLDLGWAGARIAEAFAEIAEALS